MAFAPLAVEVDLAAGRLALMDTGDGSRLMQTSAYNRIGAEILVEYIQIARRRNIEIKMELN